MTDIGIQVALAIRNGLAQIIEQIDDILKQQPNNVPRRIEIPNLDITDIQELPWKTRAKTFAGPTGYAWMFCHNDRDLKSEQQEIVDSLCSAIATSPDKQVDLGEFIFKFSGRDNALLNRVPKRQETAK